MRLARCIHWSVAALVCLLLAPANCRVYAQDKSAAPEASICHDGPYVWFRDSGIERLVVSPDAKEPAIRTDLLSRETFNQQWLEVQVGDPTPAQFQVRLRPDHAIPKSTWEMPERLLVTSDLEGNFDAFVRILRSQGAVDETLKWSFGSGHLVVLGDSVDRGNYVPQCLWLIYQLEAEAEAAGGAVHFILGNHEAMNLAGDARYLALKYKWLVQETGLKIEDLYSRDSELGRWLRSKNAMVKIGDRLFVHAGISPLLLERGWQVDEINQVVRDNIGKTKLEGDGELVVKSSGPLWYRGLVVEKDDEPKATLRHVRRALEHFNAKQIVVGHTVVDSISTDFEGGVMRVDLKHPTTRQHGVARALLIENGQDLAVGDDGSRELVR